IRVSGPSVTRGYVTGPDATGGVGRDGWLATGDLGYLADGELFVCGRRKEMIIVGGRNYFPQDIERVVNQVPGVRAGGVAAFAAIAPGHPDKAGVGVEARGPVAGGAFRAQGGRRVPPRTA